MCSVGIINNSQERGVKMFKNVDIFQKSIGIFAAILFVFTFTTGTLAADKVIRYGFPTSLETPTGICTQLFKRLVEEKSGGAMEVQLFPALQLGKIVEQIEGVRSGTQEMMMSTPAWFSRFYAQIDVLSLPYLVTDWKSVGRLIKSDAFNKLSSEAEQATEIKIVGALPIGFRNVINSKRSVKKIEDLSGLKLRLQDSQVHLATFQALGASPIALPWAEVYQAVQTNVVDGLENNLTELLSFKFYEVAPYISRTNHFFSIFLVYLNKEFFDQLTNEEKRIIADAMRASEILSLILGEQGETKAARDLVNAGAKLNDVSKDTILKMQKAVEPVYKKFGEKFEPTLSQLQKAAAGQ